MTARLFPYPRRAETSLAGWLLGRIEVLLGADPHGIAIEEERQAGEGVDVLHMVVKLEGDERPIRIITAPADAEIFVIGDAGRVTRLQGETEHAR